MNDSDSFNIPEKVLVSVIVPVYNVERYLERCVDSILHQTHQNIEIILVDDGSTDNSGNLCDGLIEKDKRIKVLHKKNGGLSSARNAGMQVADGTFFLFCDSDDTVDEKWAETLLLATLHHPDSLVVCGIAHINEYNGTKRVSCAQTGQYDKKQYYKLISPGVVGSVCIKIFEKAIIEENHLAFDEEVRYAEDVVFTLDYLNHISSFFVIGKPLYNYYHYNPEMRATITSNITYQQMKYICEKRLPFIAEEDKKDYTKTVFGNYWSRFIDLPKRKDITFKDCIKEAKNILNDNMFQEYISEHGENMFDALSLRLIKKGDAFGYYLFHKIAKLKNKIVSGEYH